MRSRIIRRSFFQRDPITCARDLVGTELIWGKCAGIIVETEAYLAEDDVNLIRRSRLKIATGRGEWSRRETSDMDGSAREGELAGSERINAFHL